MRCRGLSCARQGNECGSEIRSGKRFLFLNPEKKNPDPRFIQAGFVHLLSSGGTLDARPLLLVESLTRGCKVPRPIHDYFSTQSPVSPCGPNSTEVKAPIVETSVVVSTKEARPIGKTKVVGIIPLIPVVWIPRVTPTPVRVIVGVHSGPGLFRLRLIARLDHCVDDFVVDAGLPQGNDIVRGKSKV
jgi:hypothetical protein